MDDFTKAKEMSLPRDMLMGHGVLSRIADVCDRFNFGRDVTVVTGNDTYGAAGRTVESILSDSGYSVDVIRTGNATPDNVSRVVGEARGAGSKALLAVGGGSKIDIGKMAARELRVPLVSIPTSASHDGIASGRASLKSDTGSTSVDAVVPLGIVADTEVILRSPYRLLASGCADVISNLTALLDWDLARKRADEEFSSYAYTLSQYAAESIIEDSGYIRKGSEDGVWRAVKPIIISGLSMSIAGTSRPTSGAEHMFSHALDLLGDTGSLHGEQCGVGSIMMMYLHGGDWERIRDALRDLGAPVDAKGLGYGREDVIKALVDAHRVRDRFTILGNGLTEEEAESVAAATGVI